MSEDGARGWARFGIHFIGFAAVPIFAAGIARYSGVGVGWFSSLTATPLFVLGTLAILFKELIELWCDSQGWRKSLIDFAAMTGGLFVGLSTWTGWWA